MKLIAILLLLTIASTVVNCIPRNTERESDERDRRVEESREGEEFQEDEVTADEKSDIEEHDGKIGSVWSRMRDIWLNADSFSLFFIPVILLSLVFMVFAAAYSPLNADTHYIVDEGPGGTLHGHGVKHGLLQHGIVTEKVEALTKRILGGIEKLTSDKDQKTKCKNNYLPYLSTKLS